MLACDQTITVVKYDEESEQYTATVVVGVSWFEKTRVKVEGAGLVYTNVVQIRIPAAVTPPALPEVGDHVIKGRFSLGIAVTRPADLAPYHPRKIMVVGDNRRGRLPHVAVSCQ